MGGDDDARIGTILANRYRVVELISIGGMGSVYRGERLELGRPVAIKFLHSLFISDKSFRGRFEREARAMSRLSHPYCVSVIDFGMADSPYIVMDFVIGRTLRDLMREKRLTTDRSLRIAAQILTGLAHAHGRSIIHRDIKPENIMLCEATGLGEHVRIFDFGLAKLLDSTTDADFSTAAAVIGTPSYMSPEQSFGEAVDHTADIYSTGVVLFEMLTGKKPFQSDDAAEVIRMHRLDAPPRLADADPDIPWSPKLEAVIAKALSKRRMGRFQSADDFASTLADAPEAPEQTGVMSPLPPMHDPDATTELRPESLRARSRPPLDRRAWLLLGGVGLGLAALVVVLVLALTGGDDAAPSEDDTHNTAGGAEQPAVTAPTEAPAAPPTAEPDAAPEPETTPAPAPAPAPTVDPQVKVVREMIAAGKHAQAISVLQELRSNDPDNAELAYLLGNLFFDKKYYSAGVDRYAQAVDLDPAFREDERLLGDLIAALSGDKLHRKVRSLFVESIGKPALPRLRQAAQSHGNFKVRLRAASIVNELEQ